jgi:gentisate 1,2-dioxygenase
MPVTTPGGTTPLDMISGTYTVQLNSILAALVQQGILSSSSYIDNWQAGFEVVDGSGSATINSLSYDWNNAYGDSFWPPTITSFSPDSGVSWATASPTRQP